MEKPRQKKKKGRCHVCGRQQNLNTKILCNKCNKFKCKKKVRLAGTASS